MEYIVNPIFSVTDLGKSFLLETKIEFILDRSLARNTVLISIAYTVLKF